MSPEAAVKPDFETLFNCVPGLYLVLDPGLRIVAASDAYLQATLTCRAAILGRHVFEIISDNPGDPGADTTSNFRASFNRVLRTREPDAMVMQRCEVRRAESEGGGFEVSYRNPVNFPVLHANGSIAYIIHRVEDVTATGPYPRSQEAAATSLKLKLVNEGLASELADRAAELQAILDTAPVALWIAHDPECLRITGNAYADQIVMHTARGGNVSRSAPAGDEAVSYRVFRDQSELRPEELPAQLAAATGKPVPEAEYRLVFAGGRTVHMLIGAVPLFDADGRLRGSIGAGIDVTTRKQAEEALRASEQRLRMTLDGTGVGTFEYRPETAESFWDAGAKAVWGIAADAEIAYPQVLDLVHPEDRALVRTILEPCQSHASAESARAEFRVIWADGSVHWIVGRSRTLLAGEGGPRRDTRVMGVYKDITERKEADAALQERTANYRTLSETMLQGVVYQDAEGRILSMNPAAETILGKTHAEILGNTSVDVERDTIREDGSRFPGLEHPSMVALGAGHEVRNVRMGVFNPRVKDYRWIEVNAVPLFRSGESKPFQVYTIFEDITARRMAEEALRESEVRLAFALEAAQLGAWEVDLATRAAWRSAYHGLIFGYSGPLSEWSHEMFLDHVLPEDREEAYRKFREAKSGGMDLAFECRIRRADGAIRWIRVHGRNSRDKPGTVRRISGVVQDVTARKEVEDTLRDSEERFRTLANAIPQLCWMANADGWIFWYNHRWYEYTGTTPDQMQGWGWQSVHDPDVLAEVLDRWKSSIATGEPFDMTFPIRGADGDFRPFLTRVMPVRDREGRIGKWFGTNTDISEQRKIEEALRGSEELLKTFVRHVPAAVAMLDREMRYLQVSDRWCADYALRSADLLSRSHYEVFPEIPERWKQIHRRCLAGETLRADEDLWERGDGAATWLRWEIRPWGDSSGQPAGILIFSEDITARRQIEASLRESEATIRALLETAAQSILAVDSEGRMVLANRMAEAMFGYGRDELLGMPLEKLMPEQLRIRHIAHRKEFEAHPRSRPMGTGLDLQGLRKDGTEFSIEVSLSTVETGRGTLAVAFVTDITSRKRAEAALQRSENELRALARNLLTAQEDERRRVARDLHDDVTQRLALLSIEIGKLAADTPSLVAEVAERLRSFQGQARLASHEVRRLSHGLHPSVIEDFGLSTALEEFCEEFAKAQGIEMVFEGPAIDARLNWSGASCLYRIAQECLRNVAKHSGATEVRVAVTTDGGNIRLTVQDNGAGFPVSRDRTSSGLGLISMQERLRIANGTLSIVSNPGQGTEIVASVPLNRGAA